MHHLLLETKHNFNERLLRLTSKKQHFLHSVSSAEVWFCVHVLPLVSHLHKGVLAHLLSNNTSHLHCHAKLAFIGHVHTRKLIHTD